MHSTCSPFHLLVPTRAETLLFDHLPLLFIVIITPSISIFSLTPLLLLLTVTSCLIIQTYASVHSSPQCHCKVIPSFPTSSSSSVFFCFFPSFYYLAFVLSAVISVYQLFSSLSSKWTFLVMFPANLSPSVFNQ